MVRRYYISTTCRAYIAQAQGLSSIKPDNLTTTRWLMAVGTRSKPNLVGDTPFAFLEENGLGMGL